MATPSPTTTNPTIYFGYGSNLWLHQMRIRCPTSSYLGVARLNAYHWIINDRGYANVVSSSPQKDTSSTQTKDDDSKYANVVFGLVYTLEKDDERRLDKNEGVPIAYTKELLACDFWPSSTEKQVDTSQPPDCTRDMLVYIDRERIEPDEPREEYVYRMNRGISDAVKMGVPEGYVEDVMRKFIPAEAGGEAWERRKSVEEWAARQAAEFRDESGVFR